MGNSCFGLFTCIDQASVGVLERWGRFEKLAEPGFHLLNPCAGQWVAGVLSTRISSLDVRIETKTKDNVFVQLVCSIQYRVVKQNADDAFYELQNPKEQIQAYVFDVVRALVPRMTLDELFEQKGEVAKSVLEELEKVMREYGYSIEHILMVDIIPDAAVRKAMNEINAAQRLQLANVYKGEAEKVLQVKRAEADAEAKYLGGVGVARQRQAITDGLRENILNFSGKVEGTSAKEVMDLIMITQYFDTIKDLGNNSKNTTVFIPHAPGHVRDICDQIRNGKLEASSAQVNGEYLLNHKNDIITTSGGWSYGLYGWMNDNPTSIYWEGKKQFSPNNKIPHSLWSHVAIKGVTGILHAAMSGVTSVLLVAMCGITESPPLHPN